MVTMANFVTGPFLDLFGATVYDHLKLFRNVISHSIVNNIVVDHGFTNVNKISPPKLNRDSTIQFPNVFKVSSAVNEVNSI